MSRIRVCFLGTPEFAAYSLRKMLEDDHYEIVGVVTQPDRPAGRKMQITPSSVKNLALSRGLRVITPESVNKDFILDEIQKWSAEVAVVVAFGQILSEKFLSLFKFGAVNVHASLLPKWRGAAPIQRAIEAGDTETGVALQKIVKQLDAGDIIGSRRVKLDENITAIELHDELAVLGADLLHVELMDYLRGNLAPIAQDHSMATFAKKIDKLESEINWQMSAKTIHDKIRAFTMGPGTFTYAQQKKLKIHRSVSHSEEVLNLHGRVLDGAKLKLGEVKFDGERVFVRCQSGFLEILDAQPESRNRLRVRELFQGNFLREGEILGKK